MPFFILQHPMSHTLCFYLLTYFFFAIYYSFVVVGSSVN